MPFPKDQDLQNEYIAELLKERIYATFALIAVLVTIDADYTSILHAAYIITGTIVSLWAASIAATTMSRRMIFQNSLNHDQELRHQIRVHAPMLFTLISPLTLLGLAWMRLISLSLAVNISLFGALLLLVIWSIHSSRSLHSKKVPTFILILLQLAIGLGIIVLKVVVGH